MDTFAFPSAGLNADEAINGQYGAAVQPAAVQAAGSGSASPMALPAVPNWSAVLIWWFLLLGAAVAMHVLFIRIND